MIGCYQLKESYRDFYIGCALCILKSRASCLKIPCAAGTKPPQGGFDVEMMGFLGAGNNPMVGMTVAVAVAVAVEQALK